MVIHWLWFRKEVVFYGGGQSTRNLGPYRGKDVDWIHREHMSIFSEPRIHCPEVSSKAKALENCRYTSAPMVRLFIISVNQLSLYEAVSDMCEPAHEEDLLQRYQERIEKLSQQDRVKKILYWCRIPHCSCEWTVFHDERHWRILTIHRFSSLSWVHCTKRDEETSEPKSWIRKNTKIGHVLEVTTVAYKVNMEWKLELGLKTRTILTRKSEFLMDWTSWSRTWSTMSTTTTSKRPQRCNSKTMRWNRMHVLLRAEQRLKQNHKDVFRPQNFSYRERTWTDIEPQDYSPTCYSASKKLINLLGTSGNVFVQIQRRLLRQLIRKSRAHGSLMYQSTQHHMW